MHNYFADISEYAERNAPNEICGFLHNDGQQSLRFTPARNLLSAEEFMVDPADVIKAYNLGPIEVFVHSHCTNDEKFSDVDLESLDRTRVPWLVYSTKSKLFNFRRPTGLVPTLQGRQFILGLHDCAGLVMDYFLRFFDVRFPYFTRTQTVLNLGYPWDCVTLHNYGFRPVEGPVRPHDIVLMKFAFGLPVVHTGVIVKDDLLLHHVRGKVSAVEQYSGAWSRLTQFIYRHPEFTSKLPVL